MKQSLLIFFTVILGLLTPTFGYALTQEEEHFIREHYVDESIARELDRHHDQLFALVSKIEKTDLQKHGVWTFDWLPGYYVKYNILRIFNVEKIRECIAEFRLDLMHAPEKKLYHIKGRPLELDNLNYLVVIKKVRSCPVASKKPLTRRHVQQFITIIKQTGHISTAQGNYLRIAPDGISFIDTDGTFDKARAFTGIIRLLEHKNLKTYYTQDALRYLLEQIAELLKSMPTIKQSEALSHLKKLSIPSYIIKQMHKISVVA
jgi:hypothetical protein